MEHDEAHRKMFEKFLKCKKSHYWAENLLLKAIKNWITKKYSEVPALTLRNDNRISITFFQVSKINEYEIIIDDVCKEFNLEKEFRKYCCVKRFTDKKGRYHKTIEYELYKNGGE